MRLENLGTYTHEGGFQEIYLTEIVNHGRKKIEKDV